MTERVQTAEAQTPAAQEGSAPVAPPPPRRGPGHRGQDVRDAVAEMAARAQLISQEAGSKMSGALRDVVMAGAGMAAFAVESARDLVQYMVRRGQMTQEEADKLIREAEEASVKRGGAKLPPKAAAPAAPAKGVTPSSAPHSMPDVHTMHAVKQEKAVARPTSLKPATKTAPHKHAPVKAAPAKAPAKAAAKVVAKKPAPPAKKAVAKSAKKSAKRR